MSRSVITIVGAAGFLGQACTAALAARGARVLGVDIAADPGAGAAEWQRVGPGGDGPSDEALARSDVVVNLAWRNDPGRGNADMAGDAAGNVAGAVGLFERAARAGVRRLVYASSGGTIYGDAPVPTGEGAAIAPLSGYGAGKAAVELYLRAIHHGYGTQVSALRIANPYGPGQLPNRGQGFIATAIARALAREPIQIFGSAELARDYVYIADVADAMALACADQAPWSVLNVGSGACWTLAELVPLIFAAVGHGTAVETLPGRPVDVARTRLDVARIRDSLGWTPATGMAEGLARTVAWQRAAR